MKDGNAAIRAYALVLTDPELRVEVLPGMDALLAEIVRLRELLGKVTP